MPFNSEDRARYNLNRQREQKADVRDIVTMEQWKPFVKCQIKNARRRKRCKSSLRAFLEEYFEEAFYADFGADHLKLIETTQRVCLEGGRVIAALPRGSGKTTIFQRAIVWATLFGHSKFAVLATADDRQASTLLDGIRIILENTEPLFEDFPEVCLPIRALEGVSVRCQYQLWDQERTRIRFSVKDVYFPTIPMSRKRGNAGSIIRCGGLTSAMRGLVVTTKDGGQSRPDFILVDDPQTKKSSRSPSQVTEREDIINGDLAHMAGVGKKMSVMVAATVIEQDDLACRLLDNDRSPDWIAYRVPMLYSMPENMNLWDDYDNIRRQEAVFELESGSANNFYTDHREKMDSGALHYWPDRIDPDRVSAIQSAMDAFLKSPRAFASECQNDPETNVHGDLEPLSSIELCRRQGLFAKGKVPTDATHLTCHIDVQLNLLYWMVVAWNPTFRGCIIDYGTYPEQSSNNFDLTRIRATLQKASPGNDDDGAIAAGIETIVTHLSGMNWAQGDAEVGLSLGLVDARYKTDAIERGLMAAGSRTFMPCYGIGIGAKNRAMTRWVKKAGAWHGHNWIVQKPERRHLRSLFVDTNFWKSQAYGALKIPKEHGESITFFKTRHASRHQMAADHFCAEVVTRVDANGRIVDEWDLPSNRPDNHFWDTLVGCMAGASTLGIKKHDADYGKKTVKKKSKKKRIRSLNL